VSSDFFSILGVKPVAGRLFAPGEDEIGRSPLVHHQRWIVGTQNRFTPRRSAKPSRSMAAPSPSSA